MPRISVKIDPNTGQTVIVRDSQGQDEQLLAALVSPRTLAESTKRVSHVLPVNPVLRVIFRWLRDKFGERGRMAKFTRQWPCLWRADMSPTGKNEVLGPYKNRQDAIAAEVEWLYKHLTLLQKSKVGDGQPGEHTVLGQPLS